MTSSEFDLPAPDGAEPSGPAGAAPAPVARAVAEDLEAIFPDQPAEHEPAPRRLRLRRPRAERAGGRERRAARLGGLIAAACVGISAGALLARHQAPGKPPPVSPGAPIAAASLPAPGPLAVADAATAPVVPPASPAPKPADVSQAGGVVRAQAPSHRQVHAARTCGRERRCGAAALKAADARLRRAYLAAARAGAPRAVLADYRHQWERLRRRGAREPALVAARYRRMASELDRLAARERIARADPPGPRPWRRIRTQLAALWR